MVGSRSGNTRATQERAGRRDPLSGRTGSLRSCRCKVVDRVGRNAWKGVKQGASGKAWGRGDSAAGSIRFEVTEAGLTNAKNFILARSVFRSVRPAVLTWSISDFRLLAQSQPH